MCKLKLFCVRFDVISSKMIFKNIKTNCTAPHYENISKTMYPKKEHCDSIPCLRFYLLYYLWHRLEQKTKLLLIISLYALNRNVKNDKNTSAFCNCSSFKEKKNCLEKDVLFYYIILFIKALDSLQLGKNYFPYTLKRYKVYKDDIFSIQIYTS